MNTDGDTPDIFIDANRSVHQKNAGHKIPFDRRQGTGWHNRH